MNCLTLTQTSTTTQLNNIHLLLIQYVALTHRIIIFRVFQFYPKDMQEKQEYDGETM